MRVLKLFKLEVIGHIGDARHRARIDSAMDWHHNNIRRGSAGIVFNRIIAPRLGQQINSAAAEDAEKLLIEALKVQLMLNVGIAYLHSLAGNGLDF